MQEVATVDTEKIRAHMLTTLEETYRQELAEVDSVGDGRERQHGRDAVDVAHAMRRTWVDELFTSPAKIEARGDLSCVFLGLSRIVVVQGARR